MEDAGIIELFWERSERAIAELSEKYGAFCFAVAMNVLSDAEDAEECVNDTWLRAWTNGGCWLRSFPGPSIHGWAASRGMSA